MSCPHSSCTERCESAFCCCTSAACTASRCCGTNLSCGQRLASLASSGSTALLCTQCAAPARPAGSGSRRRYFRLARGSGGSRSSLWRMTSGVASAVPSSTSHTTRPSLVLALLVPVRSAALVAAAGLAAGAAGRGGGPFPSPPPERPNSLAAFRMAPERRPCL
eukprot:scaffold10026_cov62-Phaeocystis_antarctica.AAC.6